MPYADAKSRTSRINPADTFRPLHTLNKVGDRKPVRNCTRSEIVFVFDHFPQPFPRAPRHGRLNPSPRTSMHRPLPTRLSRIRKPPLPLRPCQTIGHQLHITIRNDPREARPLLNWIGMFVPGNFALVIAGIVSGKLCRAAYDLGRKKTDIVVYGN